MKKVPDYRDIVSILDFLFQKTIEDGGDGEAVWLTRHYKLDYIVSIIKLVNIKGWNIELKDNYVRWGENQEGVIITNDENIFNNTPTAELHLKLH